MTESRSQKNTNNSWTRGYPTPQCTHCALETFPSVADLPLSHWCQHPGQEVRQMNLEDRQAYLLNSANFLQRLSQNFPPADAVLRSWPQGVANQSAATTLLGHKVGGSQRLPPFFSSHFGILWQDEKVYSFLEASFPFSSSLSGYPCHHWWDGAGDQIYIHPEHPTVHLDLRAYIWLCKLPNIGQENLLKISKESWPWWPTKKLTGTLCQIFCCVGVDIGQLKEETTAKRGLGRTFL